MNPHPYPHSVNITFQDPTQGAPKLSKLIPRFLVMAALTHPTRGHPERAPVQLTKQNFKSLAGFSVTLDGEVRDLLGDSGDRRRRIPLTFTGPPSHWPAQAVQQDRILAQEMAKRTALLMLRARVTQSPDLERWCTERLQHYETQRAEAEEGTLLS